MSTGNIINMLPIGEPPDQLLLTFKTKKGTRTYLYVGHLVVVSIMMGADPKDYNGELVDRQEF